jgi:hypothetical protein
LVHGGDREPHHPPHSWAEIRRLNSHVSVFGALGCITNRRSRPRGVC